MMSRSVMRESHRLISVLFDNRVVGIGGGMLLMHRTILHGVVRGPLGKGGPGQAEYDCKNKILSSHDRVLLLKLLLCPTAGSSSPESECSSMARLPGLAFATC